MFQDTKEELARLEAELLEDDEDITEQEDPEELLETIIQEVHQEEPVDMDATQAFLGSHYTGNIPPVPKAPERQDSKAYNGDRVEPEARFYEEEAYGEQRQGSITGLLVTAAVLSTGILAVVIFWMIRYWGVLG